MPNKYVRTVGSRKYRDFSDETLQVALHDIERNNLTYRKASEKYGIPKSTLERKFNRKNTKNAGGQTQLTEIEEKNIIEAIMQASDWGFPLERSDIQDLVQGYLNRLGKTITKFRDNRPGDSWYYGFISRHTNLTLRLSENIKRSRAAVSVDILNKYFDNLANSLKDVPPQNILNYDETGFVDDPGRNKVVVRRKAKHAERVMDSTKTNTSVMFCVSGSGITLPVYIVYKADHIWSTWTERGPENARYNRSKSGWFDQALFEDWFMTVALPYFRKLTGPKVLLGDNLSSHVSIKVLQECIANNIRFVLLPPNSTHLCQPLDVSCFRSIKGAWKRVLKVWKKKNRGPLRKDMFPSLLRQTLEKIGANHSDNIVAGFKATGLIPLDRNSVLKKLPNQDVPDDDTSARNIAITMKSLFEELRYGKQKATNESSTPQPVKRKKKLDVPAGKSVAPEDLKTLEENESTPSTSKMKTKKKKLSSTASDSENDQECSSSHNETEEAESPKVTEPYKKTFNELEIDDFVIVELETMKGRHQRFIGRVISTNPHRCSFLRESSKTRNTFIFPSIPDEGDIEPLEYISTLATPTKLRRGAYRFDPCILERYLLNNK